MLISELKQAVEFNKGPKKSGLNKSVFLLLFFAISFLASYSQKEDISILSESKILELSYSPRQFFSSVTVAFLKLNSGSGIKLKFVLSATDFQSIFSPPSDSLVVIFSNNKALHLNAAFRDSVYCHNDGKLCYETLRMIGPDEVNSFKNEQVVAIRNKTHKKKFKLNIAKISQRELLTLAKSF